MKKCTQALRAVYNNIIFNSELVIFVSCMLAKNIYPVVIKWEFLMLFFLLDTFFETLIHFSIAKRQPHILRKQSPVSNTSQLY